MAEIDGLEFESGSELRLRANRKGLAVDWSALNCELASPDRVNIPIRVTILDSWTDLF